MNIETHIRRLRWPTQPEYHKLDASAHENLIELRREQALQTACAVEICVLLFLIASIIFTAWNS